MSAIRHTSEKALTSTQVVIRLMNSTLIDTISQTVFYYQHFFVVFLHIFNFIFEKDSLGNIRLSKSYKNLANILNEDNYNRNYQHNQYSKKKSPTNYRNQTHSKTENKENHKQARPGNNHKRHEHSNGEQKKKPFAKSFQLYSLNKLLQKTTPKIEEIITDNTKKAIDEKFNNMKSKSTYNCFKDPVENVYKCLPIPSPPKKNPVAKETQYVVSERSENFPKKIRDGESSKKSKCNDKVPVFQAPNIKELMRPTLRTVIKKNKEICTDQNLFHDKNSLKKITFLKSCSKTLDESREEVELNIDIYDTLCEDVVSHEDSSKPNEHCNNDDESETVLSVQTGSSIYDLGVFKVQSEKNFFNENYFTIKQEAVSSFLAMANSDEALKSAEPVLNKTS